MERVRKDQFTQQSIPIQKKMVNNTHNNIKQKQATNEISKVI